MPKKHSKNHLLSISKISTQCLFQSFRLCRILFESTLKIIWIALNVSYPQFKAKFYLLYLPNKQFVPGTQFQSYLIFFLFIPHIYNKKVKQTIFCCIQKLSWDQCISFPANNINQLFLKVIRWLFFYNVKKTYILILSIIFFMLLAGGLKLIA